MTGRRGLVLSLVLVAGGATAVLLAAGRPWWTVTVHAARLPTTTDTVTGSVAAPATIGLGVLGLAAVAAVLATRGGWRQAVGVVVALAGLAAVASAWSGRGVAGSHHVASTAGAGGVSLVAVRSAWPWLALLGALGMVVGGALVVAFGARWPGWSGRYDAPGPAADAPGATTAAAPHELWDALDRGEDPTASPDVAVAPDLPE